MNPYWIKAEGVRLGIMARPRGDDWLADDIGILKRAGVDVIVSALTSTEAEELGCSESSIGYTHCLTRPHSPKVSDLALLLLMAMLAEVRDMSGNQADCREVPKRGQQRPVKDWDVPEVLPWLHIFRGLQSTCGNR